MKRTTKYVGARRAPGNHGGRRARGDVADYRAGRSADGGVGARGVLPRDARHDSRGASRKARKRSGCTICSRRSSIEVHRLRSARRRRARATRAISRMPSSCRSCCGVVRCARCITGAAERATLKELARTYQNLVEDAHARDAAPQGAVSRARDSDAGDAACIDPTQRSGVARASCRKRGVAVSGGTPCTRSSRCCSELRPQAKAAMLARGASAIRPGACLRTIPFLGPVRVALLLATMQTPWRFRTKRNLWAYAGLGRGDVGSSAEYELAHGRPVRRRRAPMTRGLNRNHNRVLKIGVQERGDRGDARGAGHCRISIAAWSRAGCARNWRA